MWNCLWICFLHTPHYEPLIITFSTLFIPRLASCSVVDWAKKFQRSRAGSTDRLTITTKNGGVLCPCAGNCSAQAEGRLRLRGVSAALSGIGRVEVCHNGLWGLICTGHWSQAASEVVCRQLGYNAPYALRITPDKVEKWANARIYTHPPIGRVRWLDRLYCDGTEPAIQNCTRETSAQPARIFSYLQKGSKPSQCADPVPPFNDLRKEVAVVACFGE